MFLLGDMSLSLRGDIAAVNWEMEKFFSNRRKEILAE